MHIAYSAISATQHPPQGKQAHAQNNELMLRYQAYQAACNKYSQEIVAIQQRLPGWEPKFSY